MVRIVDKNVEQSHRNCIFWGRSDLFNKQIANKFFHVWENGYVQSEATDCGVSFAPNFPPFIGAYSLQVLRFASASEAFNGKSFSHKKVKNFSEIGEE